MMLMRTLRFTLLVAFLSLALVVPPMASEVGPQARERVELQPEDLAVISRGRDVYLGHCSSCHGLNLEGQPNWQSPLATGRMPAPPHDETGHTWHHPDWLLFDLVKRGTTAVVGGDYASDMPGYKDTLSDSDIIAALSFIKSEWPEEIRKTHDRINRCADE